MQTSAPKILDVAVNRRAILRGAVATMAFAGGVEAAFAQSRRDIAPTPRSGGSETDALTQLDETRANQLLNTKFEFWNLEGRAQAVLLAVNSRKLNRNIAEETLLKCFELEFLVLESTQAIPEGLCHVMHPKLGFFELFLVSRKATAQTKLTADFSRF